MEDYENREWGYVIGFVLAVILCWNVTGWTADAIGYGDALKEVLERSQNWGDGWWLAFRALLTLAGAAICVAAFFIAAFVFCVLSIAGRWLYGIVVEVVRFIIDIVEWLLNRIVDIASTILLFIWDVLTWPFRSIFGLLADLYAAFAQSTKRRRYERARLKQAYKEKYQQDFRSFREFTKYWKAVKRGENPPYPGSEGEDDNSDRDDSGRRKKNHDDDDGPGGSSGPRGNGRDPYQVALDIFGLAEPFTKSELRARYRIAIAKYHPDKTGGDDREAKRVNMARDVILKRKGWS